MHLFVIVIHCKFIYVFFSIFMLFLLVICAFFDLNFVENVER